MKEEWKPIEGWCYYEVSNLGRVRSLYNVSNRKSGTNLLSITTLKSRAGTTIKRVSLRDGGYRKGVLLKKLVAEAFLPSPKKSGMYIKHKDGNSSNCEASNLYYCSVHPNSEVSPHRRKRHTSSVCL